MKKTLWTGLLLSLGCFVHAQELIVKDQMTGEPLELVTIHSNGPPASAVTDAQGRAELTDFEGADSIHFRYVGYESAVLSFDALLARDFEVLLAPSQLSLDAVVVAATRWRQQRRDIPNKVTTIRPAEVALQNPQTAADLLAASGEVFIQKSQLGGGSPMIRGFATNRVLLVVDGVRMNTAIFRSGNVQNVISLDPLAIEKTEVIFGPGSVIYGSDAIGGVMSFRTLEPQLAGEAEAQVKGNALARYASANEELTGHLDVQLSRKKWASLTSFSFSGFGDLRMGANGPDDYLRHQYVARIDSQDVVLDNPNPQVQKPTAYQQFNLMQKLKVQPAPSLRLNYGLHFSTTTDYPRYDRLIRYRDGLPRSARWYYGPQVWMLNNFNLFHGGKSRLYDQLSLTLAHQFFKESRHDRDFGESQLRHREETVDAFSINLDFDKKHARHRLFYGLEAVTNQVGSTGEGENITTGATALTNSRYPDGAEWRSAAAYLNYRFKAHEKLKLQGGLRYNHILLQANFDTAFLPLPFTSTEINTGALTATAGLAYKPSEKWQLHLNLSTGFRAPNVDDVGKVFDSEPGAVVAPNPDLQPEYAYNAEAGLAKVFGKVLKVDATGYYTLLDNAMVRRDFTLNGQDSILYDGELSQVQAIQNAAQAYVYGFHAGVEIKLPEGFGLSSRFNFQKGEEEQEDGSTTPLRHAGPLFGNTHFTYRHNRVTLDLYVIYNGAISHTNLAPSERGKPYLYAADANGNPYSPGWHTLNFKVRCHVTEHFTVTAGVENLTDQRYRPYSSGIAPAGRNFILALRAGF